VQFEGKFFTRVGRSVALEGEVNDGGGLLDVMIEDELSGVLGLG